MSKIAATAGAGAVLLTGAALVYSTTGAGASDQPNTNHVRVTHGNISTDSVHSANDNHVAHPGIASWW